MKIRFKLIYISVWLLTGLVACKKNDTSVFDKTPNQREAEALQNYQTLITSAPYGWKAVVFPNYALDKDSKGNPAGPQRSTGFLFLFDNQNRVQTYAENTVIKGILGVIGIPDPGNTTGYQLKGLQRPSLIFNTYSYLHLLADPLRIPGKGYSSDFEFAFASVTPDTIRLQGNFNSIPVVLIKATQEEYKAYQNNGLDLFSTRLRNFITANPNLFLNTGDATKLKCTIVNSTNPVPIRTFALSYSDNKGVVQTLQSTWAPTVNSLFLKNPITYNNIVIKEVFWDDAKKGLYVQWNGKRYDIAP